MDEANETFVRYAKEENVDIYNWYASFTFKIGQRNVQMHLIHLNH